MTLVHDATTQTDLLAPYAGRLELRRSHVPRHYVVLWAVGPDHLIVPAGLAPDDEEQEIRAALARWLRRRAV